MKQSETSSSLHHSRSARSNDRSKHVYPDVLLYVVLPFLFLGIAKLANTSLFATLAGVMAIVTLAVVKLTRYKPLFFFSVFFILILVMSIIWHWADYYLIRLITGEIATNTNLALKGLAEGLITIAIALVYQRKLTHLRMKINYEWYVSATYRKFIRLMVYFFLFLLIFWTLGYLFHKGFGGMDFHPVTISAVAGGIALVTTGTLSLLYLIKPPAKKTSSRHHHSRTHHHTSRRG